MQIFFLYTQVAKILPSMSFLFAKHPHPTFHNFKSNEILRSQWGWGVVVGQTQNQYMSLERNATYNAFAERITRFIEA